MNETPDRLYHTVAVVLCVRVVCTLAENDLRRPFRNLEKSRREPAWVPHRAEPNPALEQ